MKLDELLRDELVILPKNRKSLGYTSYYECVIHEADKYLKLLDDTEDYGQDEFIGELSKDHLFSISRDFNILVIIQ